MTMPNRIGGAEVPPSPETQATEQRIAQLHEQQATVQKQLAEAREQVAVAVADSAPVPELQRLHAECTRLAEEGNSIALAIPMLEERLQASRAADAARHVEQLAANADEKQQAYAEVANAAYQGLRNAASPEFVELYEAFEIAIEEAYKARRQAIWVAMHADGTQGRFSADASDATRNAQLTQPPLEAPHTMGEVTDLLRLLARFAGYKNARPTSAELARQAQQNEAMHRLQMRGGLGA